MQPVALATVACCVCARSPKLEYRTRFLTGERWQQSLELGIRPGLEIIGARQRETGRLSNGKGEWGMKVRWSRRNSWAMSMVVFIALLCAFAPKAAAQDGVVSGQILDVTGKPWMDLAIQAVSDQGAKSDTKTDKDGNFTIRGLRNGVYTIAIQLPAPNKPYEVKVRVSGADTPKVKLNFKYVVAKQGSEYAEAQKKQEEERQKFQGMKGHFAPGVGLLNKVVKPKANFTKPTAS